MITSVSCFNQNLNSANSNRLKPSVNSTVLSLKNPSFGSNIDSVGNFIVGAGAFSGAAYKFVQIIAEPPKSTHFLDFAGGATKVLLNVFVVGPFVGGTATAIGIGCLAGGGILALKAMRKGLKLIGK